MTKSLIKKFDMTPKCHHQDGPDGLNDDMLSTNNVQLMRQLEELSKCIEQEDFAALTALESTDEERNDNIDGLIDEIRSLSDNKHHELLKNIRPIKLVLVKVR